MSPDADPAPFSWRSAVVAAYGPTLLTGAAIGTMLPVAALRAAELGASLGLAAFVVALLGAGQLVGTLPAGALVARVGERNALILGGVVDLVALPLAGFVPSLWVLGVALFLSGVAASVFLLARQGYMIIILPRDRMARGLSLLGGAMRVGMLLGPAAGAVAITYAGLAGAFAVATAFAAASLAVVVLAPDLTSAHEGRVKGAPVTRVLTVLRQYRRVLLTVGLGVSVISMLRQARLAILPLWALHIGLGGVESSSLFAMAGVIELALVYPAGWVMDRFGRTFVVAPLAVALALTLILLPLAHDYTGLFAVAAAMAVANGFGSGIIMTLGADAAPAVDRAQFLAGWRLQAEMGSAAAPALISGLTALASLAASAVSIGALGLLGAVWVTYWVAKGERATGRWDVRRPPRENRPIKAQSGT